MSRWLATIFTGLIVLIILLANTQANIFGFVNMIPFGDKWGHFVLIGTGSFLINFTLWHNGRIYHLNHLWQSSLIIAVIITVEELSQLWLPTRTFSLVDLAFNYAGILFFSILLMWLIKTGRITNSFQTD